MNTPSPQQTGSQPPQSFAIKGQYIKDLSFENPNAPHSLMISGGQPTIDVSVDIKAQKLQDDIYEMTLLIRTKATHEGKPLFLVELAYAGIFQVSNIPQERLEPLLMIDCPFILFPFARRVIADVTRDGGFPPLMMDPIDFHGLYVSNRAKQQAG